MKKKYILSYLLVVVLPGLAAALVVWRVDRGEACSGLVWVPLVVALVGSFAGEYLAKWLKRRLGATMEREALDFNLALMVFALVALFFNSAGLLLVYWTGKKLLALLVILLGMADAALGARNVLKAQ